MANPEPRSYWLIVDRKGNSIDAYDEESTALKFLQTGINDSGYRIIQVQEVPNG